MSPLEFLTEELLDLTHVQAALVQAIPALLFVFIHEFLPLQLGSVTHTCLLEASSEYLKRSMYWQLAISILGKNVYLYIMSYLQIFSISLLWKWHFQSN